MNETVLAGLLYAFLTAVVVAVAALAANMWLSFYKDYRWWKDHQ